MPCNLYLDIESVPSPLTWAREEIASTIKPPGTLKKAESIAEWERDSKPAAVEDAWLKTSFDGGLGQIIVIGWAVDDGPVQSLTATLELDSERDMLRCWFRQIGELYTGSSGMKPTLVGFNSDAFDIPFIWKRAMVLGVKPPFWFPRDPKPWSDSTYDCMTAFSGFKDRISMDRLCRIMGIEGKGDGPTGADVWPMFQAGRIDEIADYCEADVERTRALYKRLTFASA